MTRRDLSDLSDRELVDLAPEDPDNAYRELMRRRRGRVFELAYRMLRDHARAEDIVQDAFFNSVQGLDRYRGQGSFLKWILKIANNRVVDDLRKQQVEHVALERAPSAITPGRVVGMAHPATTTRPT